jgi:hypothetical protein
MTASTGRTVGIMQWVVLLRIAMDPRPYVPVEEIVRDTAIGRSRQQMRRVVLSLWSCGLIVSDPAAITSDPDRTADVRLHSSAWDVTLRLRADSDPNVQIRIDAMYRAAREQDKAA